MFDADCAGCGSRVLLTTTRITALQNTDHGIVVEFVCWCGTGGRLVTGRRAQPSSR